MFSRQALFPSWTLRLAKPDRRGGSCVSHFVVRRFAPLVEARSPAAMSRRRLKAKTANAKGEGREARTEREWVAWLVRVGRGIEEWWCRCIVVQSVVHLHSGGAGRGAQVTMRFDVAQIQRLPGVGRVLRLVLARRCSLIADCHFNGRVNAGGEMDLCVPMMLDAYGGVCGCRCVIFLA